MPQLIINGIIMGSIIVLGSIGLTLTYGILNFANFAHGDIMAAGAYLCLFFLGLNVPFVVAVILSMCITAGLGILIDWCIYRKLREKTSVVLLIASIGAALFLRNVVQLIFGPQLVYYSSEIQMAKKLPFGIRIKPDEIFIIAASFLLIIAVHLFLKRSRIGKAMRALSDNMQLAGVIGIETEKIIFWTWGLGCALAAAGGIFLGLEVQLRPMMGWDVLLPIFAAVILGGIGSPYGAMAGGMIIGISQEVSTAFINPAYKSVVSFMILILVLLIKPSGIFGKKERLA
ncbi:MAG: branched-chain amino acid ABC transporter permease [bacterium]|nr:branched-chain amino acid ABC transporter permease [bacterium]